MMFKMLVPVAVLAAGLSVSTVRANAHPVPDRAALARATTPSKGVAAKPVAKAAVQKAKASQTVKTGQPAKTTTLAKKGNAGDITGSIRRNEACAIKTVDLFDRKGNFAKSERMRVCQ